MGRSGELFGVMKWFIIVGITIAVCQSCGGQRRVIKQQKNQHIVLETDMQTEIQSVLRVLELLEVVYRCEEERDSTGKVKVVTTAHLLKNSHQEEKKQETVIEVIKEDTTDQVTIDEKKIRRKWGGWWWMGLTIGVGGCVWLYIKQSKK